MGEGGGGGGEVILRAIFVEPRPNVPLDTVQTPLQSGTESYCSVKSLGDCQCVAMVLAIAYDATLNYSNNSC